MKKILILGSNGLLSVNLKHRFKNDNNNIKYAGSKNYDFKFLVLQDNLDNILNKNYFDIILNCIGNANIDDCELNNHMANKLNIEFPKLIVDTLKKFKRKTRVIHISTDHFYDNLILSNENNIKINNYYTKSKLEGEKILMQIDSTIIRTNFIGKSFHKNKITLTDWFYNNIKNNIKFEAFEDIYFNPLSFTSLTSILEYLFEKSINGVYNVGSVGKLSKYDLAIRINKLFNKRNLIIRSKSDNVFKVNRSKNMLMDCGHFENNYSYSLPLIDDEINLILKEYLSD